jgi:hypothetical protein
VQATSPRRTPNFIGCVSSRESGNGGSIAAFDEVADELAEAEDGVANAAMLSAASDRLVSYKDSERRCRARDAASVAKDTRADE